MQEIEKQEDILLSLLDYELHTSGGDLSSVNEIQRGNFVKLLRSSKCEEIYCRHTNVSAADDPLDVLLEKSVKVYVDQNCTNPQEQLEVMCVGIASLHAFVQSNWTGPPLEPDVLPWLRTWFDSLHPGHGREFHQEVVACLLLDGEGCSSVMKLPELLLLARACLRICRDTMPALPSSQWWLLRCLFVHQQVLDEFSPTLHAGITTLLQELASCEPVMSREHNEICFHLEAAQIHLYYKHVMKSQEHCKMALKAAGMDIELTGALGKRTRFQVKELAQLTVKVAVAENGRITNFPAVDSKYFPQDLRLDDEVRLNRIKFSNDADGEFPDLQPLEQAVVLSTFVQTQKSQPKDRLADEELMPYLLCLLSHPRVWSLQMSALLQRCRLEGHHSRTVERAMMQTEELVQCIDKEEPDARSRHHYIFCSHLPPRWKVETELALLLISLGVVKSALDIFLRLELWEEVISCYNILQLRHKATEVIQQELNKQESVKLWCLLGDSTDDASCYEKAWELSGHKSGRAQRHWALYYFNKKQYAESIPHLQQSLAINSLQVSLWFRLGYAALVEEDWALCATAYQRYCSLDPESFEAWNNLSKAYVKLNQKYRAWMTLQESLKWNYENWRVWDNYMVVSTDVGKFNEVIQAYNRILDMKEKHVDTEVLKILVDAVCMSESPGDIKKKTEQLFTRLTQQVRNNTTLWQMFVRLMLSHTDSETPEVMEKTVSYLQKAFWSAVQDSHFERDTKECLDTMKITSQLMDATLLCCEKCTRPEKTVQMLASAKLCLQTLIARVKKFYPAVLSNEESQNTEMSTSLQDLTTKLEEIVSILQQKKGTL